MSFTLYPFQKEAVEKNLSAIDKIGASLEATDCGGGKTIIACEVARRLGMPVGVVCPKSVKAKWAATLKEFGIQPVFVENPEKLRNGSTPWVSKKGRFFAWNHRPLFLIVDEVHMFGSFKSQNAKMLEEANYPTLMLSASAAESPLKMKVIGSKLRLFHPQQFWRWVRQMGALENRWGGLEWNHRSPLNKQKMQKLHDSIFGCRGNRTASEILKEQLPDLTIADEPIDMSEKDREKVEKLYREMTKLEDPGAVKNLRQRQAIELIKVPYLVERAKEITAEGGSAIIFLNFHDSIDAATALLGEEAEKIDGRVSQELRQGVRDRFQANILRCLVVQIGAAGQSIDLHDVHGNAPRTALICPQFSGIVEEQAIGRIRRIGAKNRALALRLFVPGTVETSALNTTEHKRENTQILNEGIKMTTETHNKDTKEITEAFAPNEERKHSEHSPSSLKEKAKCPGFRNDNTRDKSAADRGSLGHLAIEKENLDIIPPDDELLRKCAGLCLQYLKTLREKCGAGLKEIRERRYSILDQFGHIDHIMLHGDIAELVDYKFAWGKYEADSPQFWAYSIGIWDAHPQINKITVHVLLPFQGVIDVVEWTRESDYGRLVAQVSAIIAAARRNDPASYTTGEHCAWCNNRADCSKLNQLAQTIAVKYKADELVLPPEADPALITDPEKMALAKRIAPILKEWGEKVNARALELRLSGVEIPGWELAEKSAPFQIKDPQLAWEAVKDQITPAAFAACADIKIGELEKAVARTAPKGQMAKAKMDLRVNLLSVGAARVEGVIPYLKKCK